jgi:hypothetical protein
MHTNLPVREERPWWRDAVTYQIYIRSYADSNGDGIGDINGIRSRLPYIKDLGVDCIWINPWFQSPQKDHGYDVADYMDVNTEYGTMDDAKALIKEAHDLGIRIILDLVPNHSSDLHEWFQAALNRSQDRKNVLVIFSVMAKAKTEICHQIIGKLSSVAQLGRESSKKMANQGSGTYIYLQSNSRISIGRMKKFGNISATSLSSG